MKPHGRLNVTKLAAALISQSRISLTISQHQPAEGFLESRRLSTIEQTAGMSSESSLTPALLVPVR